ncbi:DUF5695 domain-containing protein [Maribellus sp. YY47]|uniref:DUF5695 domain-containing protein n=1 Tax=Maribellus sp. YY47 TaxID=2929486 RepID=UPI002001C5C3|nr:DUF5695 domain-containing protein [Maribellus sp. YY47]MCK3684832.1 DUF5695 domain-containing protein [Maribellus sp. YY47]
MKLKNILSILLLGNIALNAGATSSAISPSDSIDIGLGTLKFSTPAFQLELLKASQTVAGLHPAEEPNFDFTPGEWLPHRNKAGYYHLGDINFRIRTGSNQQWISYSSAASRKSVSEIKPDKTNVLAASDLSVLFPEDAPLKITRYWEKDGDNLVLRFELRNISKANVEIGALGIPVIFNNNHTHKTLDQAHAENVFFDPYIGMDAGYLQVIRLKGTGQVLLVLPYGDSPFEAYNPLLDDPTRRGITFEGFHEWMVHSKAYAENEWKEATPWNNPSSEILKPGKTKSYGLKFVLADSIHDIEKTLIKNNHPVAVGVPGYVLPQDVKAELFLKYDQKIKSLKVEPEGALELTKYTTTKNGWYKYVVHGLIWGRARLTITYKNGAEQTINYKVIKPEEQVVADNGHFLTTEQWFDEPNDPFHRSPSVITYDYETKQKVTQDSRAWICGLGDEGGSGSWLNAIMKQLVEPNKEEIAKLEDFMQQTIWGGLQYSDGPLKYGVRKSMFYYQPDSMPAGTYSEKVNYKTWAAWNKEHAASPGRSYNYPHVAAAHWVMYRLARNYQGLVKQQTWDWYLEHAYQTAMAMTELAPYYAQFGQMEGSIFIHILDDLKAEGMWEYARKLEEKMKARTEHWASLNYPFGSEMPWDSTGQEEVYMWSDYFGHDDKAETTLRAILAYMPTIPHWAYNGNARRYWDFLYGGKLSRIERQIHHYGSGLNAIPVLEEFRKMPEDLYLLRVGYGGLLGTLSNITEDGFAPAAFHSFPSTLKNDGISGDYGPGFYGYAVNSSTFLTKNDEFGWLAFGGNLTESEGEVKVELTTAAKSRVYISPLKLWLTLDAGQFKSVSLKPETGKVELELNPSNDFTFKAYLRVKSYDSGATVTINGYSENNRGQYEISLGQEPIRISLF